MYLCVLCMLGYISLNVSLCPVYAMVHISICISVSCVSLNIHILKYWDFDNCYRQNYNLVKSLNPEPQKMFQGLGCLNQWHLLTPFISEIYDFQGGAKPPPPVSEYAPALTHIYFSKKTIFRSDWVRILERNKLDEVDIRDNRYDQVIHLVTAAR